MRGERQPASGTASADQKLDVAGIGLERPVHDDEVLPGVSDAQRAEPGESIPAVRFKHITPTRKGFQSAAAEAARRRRVDAGEIGNR